MDEGRVEPPTIVIAFDIAKLVAPCRSKPGCNRAISESVSANIYRGT
jgi:hypothetical protein